MFWSEIAFMLFPTRLCPSCEKRRAISRSVYLCSTCEEKAQAFSSDRESDAQSPSFRGGIVKSSTKDDASTHPLRPEVLAFMSTAEALLSPALLTSPLNEDELGLIRIYVQNLGDKVMEQAFKTKEGAACGLEWQPRKV